MVIFYINNRKQPWSGNHADFMNGMFITMPATLQVESDTQHLEARTSSVPAILPPTTLWNKTPIVLTNCHQKENIKLKASWEILRGPSDNWVTFDLHFIFYYKFHIISNPKIARVKISLLGFVVYVLRTNIQHTWSSKSKWAFISRPSSSWSLSLYTGLGTSIPFILWCLKGFRL